MNDVYFVAYDQETYKLFLAMMVTPVSCKPLFSQTGIIATELRNRLNTVFFLQRMNAF